jgi:hypothetical protein
MTMVQTTNENCYEAEANRVAGEMARKSPEPDASKAEAYSSGRSPSRASRRRNPGNCAPRSVWRGQGKRQQARGLLASVSGWFTEGFDTLDLREARAFLDTLGS